MCTMFLIIHYYYFISQAPIWLDIVGSFSSRRDFYKRFLSELSSLVAQLDSKDTKL